MEEDSAEAVEALIEAGKKKAFWMKAIARWSAPPWNLATKSCAKS